MRSRSKSVLALVLAAAAALPGCGLVKVTWPKDPPKQFSYRGKECLTDSYDESDKSQIVSRICRPASQHKGYGTVSQIGKRHRTFDDRRPDMLVAAFQAIDCSRACEGHPLDLGMSSFYAEILDAQKLTAALASVDLGEEARAAFVELAMMSKTDVLERVKTLDPRRQHMYVEVPGEVVAKRRAYFAKYGDLYGKLDAAFEKQKTVKRGATAAAAPIALEIMALRGEYLDRCGAPECRFDPFVYESTRALVTLHLVAGDDLIAAAEEDIVQEPAAGRQRFGVEVGFALYRAMEEERKAFEEYERSKDAGMDKAALDAKYGDPPPVKVDPDTDYMASEVPPRLTPRGPETPWESESGLFKSKKELPGKTGPLGEPLFEVSFKDNVTQEDITSCYETNRVTGVSFDSNSHARLEFESVCSTVGTKTNVEKIPPVLVPKSDAAKLVPGELVIAMIERKSRTGVVIRAQNPKGEKSKKVTPVTQIRSHRVAGSTAAKN